MINSRRHWA